MKKILFFYFLLSFRLSFAQDLTFIDWGPENLVNSRIGMVLPEKQLNFFVAEINQFLFRSSTSVARYEGGEKIKSKKISTVHNGIQLSIQDIISFRGQLLVFFSQKKGGVNTLYLLQYDNELLPTDELKEVASFTYGSKFYSKGEYSIIKSENENYFCVNFFLPGKNESKDILGFVVYDSLYQQKKYNEIEIPFTPEYSAIEARHLSNNGEFAVGLSIFNYASNGVWRDYSRIEKSVILYTNGDSLKQQELFLDKNKVYNYEIQSLKKNDKTSFFVTGTFGEISNGGAKGVFFQRFYLEDTTNSLSKVLEFPNYFLEEETQKNRIEFLDFQSNTTPKENQLLNYAFRAVFPQEDGGIIIVAEQYYFYEQATTDARGMSQMVNHYQYNDILIYKIDSLGTFSWIKKIPKSQHSINDYGYFLSTKVIESKNKIYCFFNDLTYNYTEMGIYNSGSNTFNFPVRKKECVLAVATIDISTGEVFRSVLSKTADTDGFVSLKISQVNKRTNEILFYSTRIKDQFGVLTFN